MLLSFKLLLHLFCFYQSIKNFYKPSVFCYICNENDISFFVWDIKKCRLTLPGHCVERYNWCDIDTQCDTCWPCDQISSIQDSAQSSSWYSTHLSVNVLLFSLKMKDILFSAVPGYHESCQWRSHAEIILWSISSAASATLLEAFIFPKKNSSATNSWVTEKDSQYKPEQAKYFYWPKDP